MGEFIQFWIKSFTPKEDGTDEEKEDRRDRDEEMDEKAKEKAERDAQLTEQINVQSSQHEIRVRNQILYMDPPLESARRSWCGPLCLMPNVHVHVHMFARAHYIRGSIHVQGMHAREV